MHPAQSAGLGRLSVLSALGQPLRAEVDVTSASREEAASMTARLAPAEAFRLAGVDYSPVLSTLRFSVATRPDGRSIVRIASQQPVDEPVVDLLVELNWAGGRLVRKYTFLLDPPEIRLEQRAIARGNEAVDAVGPVVEGGTRPAAPPRAAAPSATAPRTTGPRPPTVRTAPPAAATPSGQPATTQLPPVPTSVSNRASPAAASPAAASSSAVSSAAVLPATSPARGSATAPTSSAPSPTTAAPASAGPATVPGTVVAREGETIATVANRTKPPAIHIDQAIIALYRANPAAFFGSVHLLKAGATLTVPDEQTMASVDRIAARNEIRGIRGSRETAQSADAPGAAAATAPAPVATELARSGTPSSNTPPSTTPPASSSTASSSAELLRVARARIDELERTVDALRKEVDEADLRIAELQKKLPGSAALPVVPAVSSMPSPRSAPATLSSPSPTSAPAAASSSSSSTSAPAAPSSSPPSAPAASSPSPSPSPTAAPAGAAASASSRAPTSAASPAVASSTPSTSAPAASVPSPSVAGPPASAPASPPAEPAGGITTLVDDLRAEPALPVGGAALLATLLGGLAYRARRRRKAAAASDKPAGAGEEPPNSLFGTTAHDEFDPNATTRTHDSDAAFHSTEIDPISEAEVYVAYGRQSQAEEILRNALREHPERQPVRLRLMELLAARNDRAGFATLAGEMFDKTGGRNEEWPKAITLGLMVDPDNPIYTGRTKTRDTSASTGKASNYEDSASTTSTGSDSSAAERSAAPQDGADAVALEWPMENLRDATLEPTAAPAATAASEDALDFVPTPLPDPTSASTTASLAAEASADASNGRTGPADTPLAFELPAPIEISAPLESRSDADEPVFSASVQHGEESELLLPPTLSIDAPETNIISPMSERKRREQFDTALELALAYHELGDKEGVHEMLRDVLESGSDAQKLKARQILAKAEGTSAQPRDY